MAGPTTVAAGDAKAVRKWSTNLFLDTQKKSYFSRKFIGEDDNKVIQRLTDLEGEAGDTITYDLSVRLRQKPVSGDNRLQGKEEPLRFFSDEVKIDQLRSGVSAGGKMSRKRTKHNLRKVGNARMSEYWARYYDELMFIYLSGARGINEDFIEDLSYVGHAGNALSAPDSDHILYGDGGAKNALTTAGKMTRAIVEKANTKASMMNALNPAVMNIRPIDINGEDHYVLLMSKFHEYDLRTADTNGWVEFQKAAAAAEGRNNPIFKGNLGMLGNTVLHSHESVIRFSDYGAGANVKAARALYLGAQAGVIAFGAAGGFKMQWHEETVDHGNELVISSGNIIGLKKAKFNNRDFGNLSIDCAAADPNA